MGRSTVILFFAAILLSAATANAQTYSMGDTTVTNCSGTLFDSGGTSGSYALGEDYEFTVCPTGTPACIEVEFAAFNLNSLDQLIIHDGPDASGPVIGAYMGLFQPSVVIRAGSGCVTFHFLSLGTTQAAGWELEWDCNSTPCVAATPSPQDCANAIPICQDVYSETNAYTGTGNVPSEITTTLSCLGGCSGGTGAECNDVWYTFTTIQSGDLIFSITPDVISEDYDWGVYNLTNNPCEDIATNGALEVSCNYSGVPGVTGANGLSGSQNEPTIPVIAGETYVINVSQFSSTPNGYTINLSNSSAVIYDQLPPTLGEVQTPVVCGTSLLNFSTSENVLCTSMQDLDFGIEGPGGPYTIATIIAEDCSAGNYYDRFFTAIIDPPITTAGTFLMYISGEIQDLCTNTSIVGADTIYFEVETNPFTAVVDDVTVCPGGGSTNVVVDGNGIYNFYSIGGVSPANLLHTGNIFDPLPHVQPDSSYRFLVTETVAGCESLPDTVNVAVGSVQNASFSIEPEICLEGLAANPVAELGAAATAGGYFFMQPDNHAINSNTGEIDIDEIATNTAYTIYYGTPGICQLVEEHQVMFFQNPTADFTIESPVCTGQPALVEFVGTASNSAQFSWDFGGGTIVSGSGAGPYEISWNTPGDKTLSLLVEDIGGCVSEVFEESASISEFQVSTGPDVGIKLGGSGSLRTEISGTPFGSISYQWTPTESLDCTDCPQPQASPQDDTEYTVVTTDEAGCTSSSSIFVTVDKNNVSVPSAFSPNGDEVNDHFNIVGTSLSIANAIVYNRWGIKVYESSNLLLEEGWDGIYNNEEQPVGTYVYAINVRFEDGRERLLKGSFLLIR